MAGQEAEYSEPAMEEQQEEYGQQCSTCGCRCGGKRATPCSTCGCTCIRKLATGKDAMEGAHGKDAEYESFRGYDNVDEYDDIVDDPNTETTFDYGDDVTQEDIDLEANGDVFAALGMARQEFKKILSNNKKKEEGQNESDKEENDDEKKEDKEENATI